MVKRRSFPLALVLAVVSSFACSDPAAPDLAIASLTLQGVDASSIAPGASKQLSAVLLNAAGEPLVGKEVDWSSDANSVATVDATGMVTGVAPGTATITAASEGVVADVEVTVAYPDCAPALAHGTIAVGDTIAGSLTLADCAFISRAPWIGWTFALTQTTTVMIEAVGAPTVRLMTTLTSPTMEIVDVRRSRAAGEPARSIATLAPGTYQTWTRVESGPASDVTVTIREVSWCAASLAATPLVDLDEVANGVLDDEACITNYSDRAVGYTIVLDAPAPVHFDVVGDGFTPWIRITGDNMHDIVGIGRPVGSNAATFADVLPAGTHRVWVAGWNGPPGAFTITRRVANLTFCETAAAVGTVIPGGTVQGVLANSDCRVPGLRRGDKWSLDVVAPTKLQFNLNSSDFPTHIYVLDNAGDIIAEDALGGCIYDSRLIVDLAAGSYTVLVSSSSEPGWIGSYSLITSVVGDAQGALTGGPARKIRQGQGCSSA